MGAQSDWWPPEKCRTMLQNNKNKGLPPVSLRIYEGAYHSFDDADIGEKMFLEDAFNPFRTPTRGATLGYNAVAHKDAQKRVKAFLGEIFK